MHRSNIKWIKYIIIIYEYTSYTKENIEYLMLLTLRYFQYTDQKNGNRDKQDCIKQKSFCITKDRKNLTHLGDIKNDRIILTQNNRVQGWEDKFIVGSLQQIVEE